MRSQYSMMTCWKPCAGWDSTAPSRHGNVGGPFSLALRPATQAMALRELAMTGIERMAQKMINDGSVDAWLRGADANVKKVS